MSKKALIIDDDDMTTMCLKNFLKQSGFDPESVENGNAGIEKLKSGAFDVVLIDYKIKENGGSYGKAVLMSGDEALRAQFEAQGFNFFLHKPVSKPQFQELAGKL